MIDSSPRGNRGQNAEEFADQRHCSDTGRSESSERSNAACCASSGDLEPKQISGRSSNRTSSASKVPPEGFSGCLLLVLPAHFSSPLKVQPKSPKNTLEDDGFAYSPLSCAAISICAQNTINGEIRLHLKPLSLSLCPYPPFLPPSCFLLMNINTLSQGPLISALNNPPPSKSL